VRFPRYALRGAALAAATASAAALAQDGLQLYGTLNVDVESVAAHGATSAGAPPPGAPGFTPTGENVPRRSRVTSNSSNFGLRGRETISPGLAAFFQVESAVNLDAGNTNIASRNSAAGLEGAWGSLRAGQWDTPYKTISGAVEPMYFTGIAYTGAIIGTPGFGVGPTTSGAPVAGSPANASFERRQGNSVQYWSPAIAGLSVRLAESVDEARAAGLDPRIFSASIDYGRGSVYVAYAYEAHRDYLGLDALAAPAQGAPGAQGGSTDRGHKLVARVKLGGTQLGAIAESLRYARERGEAAPGALRRYRRTALALTLLQKAGAAGTLRAIAAKAWRGACERFDRSACDTAGLGARQVSLGYSHSFSMRTDGYVFYTRVANDERASYQFANGAGLGAAPGSASTGFLLGLRHAF
jgi:predicted porin